MFYPLLELVHGNIGKRMKKKLLLLGIALPTSQKIIFIQEHNT